MIIFTEITLSSIYRPAGKPGCVLHTDTVQINLKNVKEGALGAIEEYLKTHPEMKNVSLKHDPLKQIQKEKSKKPKKG
jgi:hypothetical protein